VEVEIADDRKARERPMQYAQRFGAFFCWRWNWIGLTSGLNFGRGTRRKDKRLVWVADAVDPSSLRLRRTRRETA